MHRPNTARACRPSARRVCRARLISMASSSQSTPIRPTLRARPPTALRTLRPRPRCLDRRLRRPRRLWCRQNPHPWRLATAITTTAVHRRSLRFQSRISHHPLRQLRRRQQMNNRFRTASLAGQRHRHRQQQPRDSTRWATKFTASQPEIMTLEPAPILTSACMRTRATATPITTTEAVATAQAA